MKVILKSEVDNLGLPGDVVDVADGYGRNFLLPRGLAIRATKGAMKEAQALTRSRKAREEKTLGGAEQARTVLESRTLRIPARVDERGRLYGSVGAADVERVLRERGHDIPRKRIELRGTIKVIGTYEVPVQVHPQVAATVVVDVVDEEGRIAVRDGAIIDLEAPPEPPPIGQDEGIEDEAIQAAERLEAAEQQEAEAAAASDPAAADTDAEVASDGQAAKS